MHFVLYTYCVLAIPPIIALAKGLFFYIIIYSFEKYGLNNNNISQTRHIIFIVPVINLFVDKKLHLSH